jgi:hypothetical protein
MHGNEAGGGAFLVEANVGWAANASQNWIVVHTHSGKNNGMVSYSIAKNTGAERSGSITVSGNGKTATFTVGQGGEIVRPVPPPPPVVFEVLPCKMHDLNWRAQALHCIVNSSVPWVAYSHDSHVHVTTTEGIPGTWSVDFWVDENPSTRTKQIGRVWLHSKEASLFLSDSCVVEQNPKPKYLEISPRSIRDIPWKGVKGQQCRVRTLSGYQSWMVKQRPAWVEITDTGYDSGAGGNGYITFNVKENDTDQERPGTIVVSDGDTESTCVLTQKKGVVLTVTPSQPPIHPYNGGYGTDLKVKSSAKWTATVTEGSAWLQLARSGGNPPGGVLKYKMKENKTSSVRQGKIKVTGGGKTVWVTVKQATVALPNFAFYKPDGWPAAAFVTTDANSKVRRETFVAGTTPVPCLRYAWRNTGAGTSESFIVQEYLPGPKVGLWVVDYPGMATGQIETMHVYYYDTDENGTMVAPKVDGTYAVTILLDAGNAVKEIDENDNATRVTFTVRRNESPRGTGRRSREQGEEKASRRDGNAVDDGMSAADSGDASDWVAVTASGGGDASAVLDGDEGTCWSPEGTGGAWVVLTYSEAVDVKDVEVVGEHLPDGMRVLLSEDADTWREGEGGTAHYVWVAFPAAGEIPVVREIVVKENTR